MKNQVLFFLAIFGLFMYTGCKKDDNNTSVKNEFVLNGSTYDLSKGFITDYGANGNGSYDFDITLTSSGVNYSDAQEAFSGTGDFIFYPQKPSPLSSRRFSTLF